MSTLLDDITSGDPQRIWTASCAIVTLRDAAELNVLCAHVPEIRAKTAGIDLGGGLLPNSARLAFALHKLEYYRDKLGCLCLLYPEWLMYDPRQEETMGNVRIDSATKDASNWTATYSCTCAICGKAFSIEQGEYHYTWWQWTVCAAPTADR